MLAKFFFFALLSAAIAAQGGNTLTDEDTLRRLAEEAAQKVVQVTTRVEKMHEEFTTMTKDRMDSLLWQAVELKTLLHKVIKDTVFKGMEKNKPLDSFRCISDKAREAIAKIDDLNKEILVETQKKVSQEVAKVMDFKFIMKEFGEFVEDFYETKIAELKKATTETIRKKIIKDVIEKMNTLQSVLEGINKQITELKYKFFEDYIHYAFLMSGALKKAESEGADHIKKCIA